MKLIGMIADHPTPKITMDEICFTILGSDCHRGGCMTVVISKDNGAADGELSSGELLRSGRIQRHVYNGDEK